MVVEVGRCPWDEGHRLARIGLKGREVAADKRPSSNLVFLIDVSGSMSDANKLPLVKSALRMLVQKLGENDRVAIVVYAGASGLALPPTSCDRKAEILASLDGLHAGGSTNGGQGLKLAYDVAVANFIKGGTNRVILCTDGDFNVGVTGNDELTRLIEARARSGVFLSALGFGMGNYKDERMERLADRGNGNASYIDSPREAAKVLVEQMSGTLVTIAKDVKIQVEFNPARVASYRLIGYEDRLLKARDFNDDRKDAGEIGAGHTVTAFYEIVPAGGEAGAPGVDPLKYRKPAPAADAGASRDLFTVKLRYKAPRGRREAARSSSPWTTTGSSTRRPTTSASPRPSPPSASCSATPRRRAGRTGTTSSPWPSRARAPTARAIAANSSTWPERRDRSLAIERADRRAPRRPCRVRYCGLILRSRASDGRWSARADPTGRP